MCTGETISSSTFQVKRRTIFEQLTHEMFKQRAPAPKGRPQQKKERQSPVVQQPKKGPTTVEKLTKALDGSSPEAQVLRESLEKAKTEAISLEPIRVSPDEVRAAVAAKIARLETAMTVLGPDDSPEKSMLEEALQKEAKLTPVGERFDSCLQFIERASKRLQLCEVDLAQVLQKKSRLEGELAQARHNLEVLRAEASETAAPPPLPPHAGEVEQLRAEVAKLRMEKEDVKCSLGITEVERLRVELQEVQKERDCLRLGQQVTPMELQTTASSRMAALIDDADAKRRCVAHHIP